MVEVHVSTMLLIHMRALLLLIEFCCQRVYCSCKKKKKKMTAREGIRMVFFFKGELFVCVWQGRQFPTVIMAVAMQFQSHYVWPGWREVSKCLL